MLLLKWKVIAPLAMTAAGALVTGIAILRQKTYIIEICGKRMILIR